MRTSRRPARRSFSAAALLLAVLALAAGCWSTGPAFHPTGAECAGQSEADAAGCEGQVCLVLSPNQQGIGGLCSEECFVDEDCTPHEKCVGVADGTFCLRACVDDDDCYDATVCRGIVGSSTRFCLADPL